MQAARLSRKIHKWIALLLGIQLFLWALSGFYMVVVHIDTIHGDMLVRNMNRNIDTDISLVLPMDQLVQSHPDRPPHQEDNGSIGPKSTIDRSPPQVAFVR